MARVSPQLICFSYHKSGTTLFWHVMSKVCDRLGLSMANHYGLVDVPAPEPDVVLLPHSLLGRPLSGPYRAIRIVRDPRDMWVSGYLYHLRCTEEWCVNADLDPSPPILWPKVDHPFAHWPEARKRGFLERLEGRSYQENLVSRSRESGLAFELEGYTGQTLAAMRDWPGMGVVAQNVKLEAVMADFDGVMTRIFDHFGFSAEQMAAALAVARTEDMRVMDDQALAARPQISSRTLSKWRMFLTPDQVAGFEAAYGDVILGLGYDLSTTADHGLRAGRVHRLADGVLGPRLAPVTGAFATAAADMTGDPAIRLWADGLVLPPTVTRDDWHEFVVPAGVARVAVRSRTMRQADPRAPYLGDGRRLGVRVREIRIRAVGEEMVIAADDPRLVDGWNAPEWLEDGPWRWTDGAGELPWGKVAGPAIVTVRCATLGSYERGALSPPFDRPAQPLVSID